MTAMPALTGPARRITTIGEICDRFDGSIQTGPFGSQLHAHEYVDSGVPVVMPQDMVDGRIVVDRIARVTPQRARTLERHRLLPGDIVYSRRGDVTRFATVEEGQRDWLCGTGSIRIRLNSPELHLPYVRHQLRYQGVTSWLLHQAKGVTMPNLNTEIIRGIPFFYPSLKEQRRIAAILDAADALRQKRRQALRVLDQLTQAIFVEMFGDPILNERDWPLATVADFVAGFESGKNLVADDEDDEAAPYRVLKVSSVTSLSYRAEERKPLPRDYIPPPSHIVRAGDLLFSRANTSELVGATALVSETPENCVLPDKIWRFVWHDRPRAEPYFVWYLFQQRRFRDQISRRATGTSGSMKNISQEKVLSIPVALPPLRLQKEFAERASLISQQRRTYGAGVERHDHLFASLQHRAFRGEL
jgi:type I restriction enzyme, S subunit